MKSYINFNKKVKNKIKILKKIENINSKKIKLEIKEIELRNKLNTK